MTTSPLKKQILSLLVLILLPLLIYSNALKGSFQFDDRNLIDQEWIADMGAFQKNVHIGEYENRPILLGTLALNNHLHKNRVFGFHLFNLLLHVFVCVLIFVILLETGSLFSPSAEADKNPARLSAFLPALLFAVHPLNTDSVTYISSRSTLLATFFYLLTLFAFLKIFNPENSWPKKASFILLATTGAYLALASKLIAATLPLALCLWFWLFIRPNQYPDLKARLFARKWLPLYVGCSLVFLAALVFWGPGFLYAPKDQGLELFGRLPYFWVETKVMIFYYLKLFFVPINLNVDAGFPFSTFSTDPGIVLAALAICAMIFLAVKTRNPWILGGILWFFMTLAPTSSIIPLSDLAVEHRMYLPMTLGLCLAVGGILNKISITGQMRFLVLLVLLFGLLTLSRNGVWTDEIRLWQDAVAKNPLSPRPRNNLGKAYHEKGRLEQALTEFLKARENIERGLGKQYNLADPEEVLKRQGENKIFPGSYKVVADLAPPHYNLASVYLDLGQLENAQKEYQIALRLNPDYFDALFGLGSVHAAMGHPDLAIKFFRRTIATRKAVTGKPDYPLARLNIGEILARAGQFKSAIRELELAVAGDKTMVLGHYNLGLAYLMTGQHERAEKAMTQCLSLNPRFEAGLFNFARIAQARGKWELSIRRFKRFLSVKGPDAEALLQIGWNYQLAGHLEKAEEHYEKALLLNPPEKLKDDIARRLHDLAR